MEKSKHRHPELKQTMESLKKNNTGVRVILAFTFVMVHFFSKAFIEPKKYFTAAEIKKASTAQKAKYLSEDEKQVITIINLARMYPKKFLKLYFGYAETNVFGSKQKLKTDYYYTTLTKELQSLKPMDALRPDFEMYKSAKCWAEEAGKSGEVGHNRKTCPSGYSAECCSYG